MKKNKILSFALVVVTVISLALSGCGGGDKAVDTTSTGSSAAAVSTSEASKLPYNETGYPIVNEKVTYKFFISGNYKDPNELTFIKMLEEKTNVHIEWNVVPASAVQERKSILFAGGDLPDVFTNNTIGADELTTYGPKGTFVELTPYIEKLMPNFKKIYTEEYPLTLGEITLPDGKIYSLPGITPYYRTRNGFYVNTEWLKKLNLAVPETPEQFYEMLKAFKATDLNGNGKKDEIPFAFQGTSYSEFMGTFGMPYMGFYIKDGKVMNAAITNEYKDGIRFIGKLYKEKLIDPEVFTQDANQFSSKSALEPTYGAFLAWRDLDIVGAENAAQYELIAPLKAPDGNRYWGGARTTTSTMRTNFVITNKAVNPEILVRWADLLYDPYYGVQVRRGTIGEVLNEAADGTLTINPVPSQYKDYVAWWQATSVTNLPYASVMKYDKTILTTPVFTEKFDQDDLYVPFMNGFEELPGFWYSQEDIKKLEDTHVGDIDKFIGETTAKWASGQGDIDKEWDKYVQTCKTMGIDTYTDVIQTVYDRYLTSLSK